MRTKLERILSFAQKHDWGKTSFIKGEDVHVWDADEQKWTFFRRMQDIRAWAGY